MKISEILNNEQQLKQKRFQWVNYVDEELVFFNEKQNKNSITKEKFFNILIENKELFKDFFDGTNENILNKMLSYNFKNHKIYQIEELDQLIENQIIYYDNIEKALDEIQIYSRRYLFYIEKPWTDNSKVALLYGNENEEIPIIDEKYKYFLPTFIIKDELLELYQFFLKEHNRYSQENLIKMIIYYAENDAHLDADNLDLLDMSTKEFNKNKNSRDRGGYAIWGKAKDNHE